MSEEQLRQLLSGLSTPAAQQEVMLRMLWLIARKANNIHSISLPAEDIFGHPAFRPDANGETQFGFKVTAAPEGRVMFTALTADETAQHEPEVEINDETLAQPREKTVLH